MCDKPPTRVPRWHIVVMAVGGGVLIVGASGWAISLLRGSSIEEIAAPAELALYGLAAVATATYLYRWRRRLARRAANLCEWCGYDRRGLTTERCPECGRVRSCYPTDWS